MSDVKQALNSDEPARDVATAENLLKKHQDLGDDIAAHQDEYVLYFKFLVIISVLNNLQSSSYSSMSSVNVYKADHNYILKLIRNYTAVFLNILDLLLKKKRLLLN